MKQLDKKILYYMAFAGILVLMIIYWQNIVGLFGKVYEASGNVIFAIVLAYLINMLMTRYEQQFFSDQTKPFNQKYGRGISLVLSIISIFAIIIICLVLVIPQMVNLVATTIESIPATIGKIQEWVTANENLVPVIGNRLEQLNINWSNVSSDLMNTVNSISQSLMGNLFGFLRSAFSSVVNFVLAFLMSLYLLINKDMLMRNIDRMCRVYLPTRFVERVSYVLGELHKSFVGFFTGAITESLIFGSLVAAGLYVLQLPYAAMLGVLSGVLALIPMLGAFVSAFIGFILILAQSPVQALIFLIFIIVLQQIDGNFIYPRVVGDSIGIPGFLVLIAVTIGGGLYGVSGMIIGVPIMAATYSMLSKDVSRREESENLDPPTLEEISEAELMSE